MTSGARDAPSERDTDLLRIYLDEIGGYPLLSAEEEVRLSELVRHGLAARKRLDDDPPADPADRRRLEAVSAEGDEAIASFVRSNLRLVVSVARRYHYSRVPLLDLVQEGNLGLLRAVEKFDGRKGFKFSTYATWWIRQAIGRGMVSHERTIRLPVHASDRRRIIVQALEGFERSRGRRPTATELAQQTGFDVNQVDEVLQAPAVVASLDEPLGDEAPHTLRELVADQAESVDRMAMDDDQRATIERLLGVLDDRERRIVTLRYGLYDGEPRSLPDVAKALELSRERIRQIENYAMSKLRHPSNEIGPLELLG